MYNTKFILSNGKELYSGYLDNQMKSHLKHYLSQKSLCMYCGCKPDEKLLYSISADLRIYPLHRGYIHDVNCCRYVDEEGNSFRRTSYMIDQENGVVTAYTSFNPMKLEVIKQKKDGNDNTTYYEPEPFYIDTLQTSEDGTEDDNIKKKKAKKKSPSSDLLDLVRNLNVDCFTFNKLTGKKIYTAEYFSRSVYFRMKKVKLSRMNKSIGELTLKDDNLKFIYLPLSSIIDETDEVGKRSTFIVTKSADGKEYKHFIYSSTLDAALYSYIERFDKEPDNFTYIAGFIYRLQSKNYKFYNVLGRICLFDILENGLLCRDSFEFAIYSQLLELCKKSQNISFIIPPDDPANAIIITHRNYNKKIYMYYDTIKSSLIPKDSYYKKLCVSHDTVLSEELIIQIMEK